MKVKLHWQAVVGESREGRGERNTAECVGEPAKTLAQDDGLHGLQLLCRSVALGSCVKV